MPTAAMPWVLAIIASGCAAVPGAGTRAPASLSPLAEGPAREELRLWRSDALLDGVEGVVVAPGSLRFLAGDDLHTAVPVDVVASALADEVLRQARSLREHDGKGFSCARIKDGWSLEVQGVSASGPYAFTIHAPDRCQDGPARDVFELHQRLTALRPRRGD